MASSIPLEFDDATHILIRGRRLLYFAGCDYLRLSGHPAVHKAICAAMQRRPFGTGASRTTTGEHAAYGQAERAIARFMRQPAAILTAAGYLAPIAAFQTLKSFATHILLADAAHACVADGATLCGLPVQRFAYADVAGLRKALRCLPRNARPVIACDGLQGARGRFAPLGSYLAVLPKRGWLFVDDAHGFGTIGPAGRGTVAAQGLHDGRIIQTISLGKSLGMQGGAVVGSGSMIRAIYDTAPAFIGNTAPLLPIAAGITAAVKLLAASPGRVERLQSNARLLHTLLPQAEHIFHDPESPVLVIYPRDVASARRLRSMLQRAGIFPSWITYLNSPPQGIFRFALSSSHTAGDVRQVAAVIGRWEMG
jgi:8-amino-7-oxononanoate synthase